MTVSLQQALEALYGLERRRNKLGLDGTRALLAALGDPQRRFHAVHVAGTNGKGSVCALVERVLRAAGARTGLFTSPHLVDFRERIRVCGRWADGQWLEATLQKIGGLPQAGELTFFEVATGLGFAWFAEQDVEWAVVEVGLGGRLDTTNVLSPDVTVVTRIGLDHTEILGDTIERIAAEKAGILKPGVPAVIDAGPAPARAVVEEAALAAGAPAVPLPARLEGAPLAFRTRRWGDLALEVDPAGFVESNAAAALAALEAVAGRGLAISADHVREGFRAARWPGRFERCAGEPRLWWDGAHNPDGVAALARRWRAAGLPAPAAVVLAVSRDKDAAAMLRELAPLAATAALVATRTRSERALDPARLVETATATGWRATGAPDVGSAVRAALEATAPSGLVLLAGSLFAVGEAMEAFGGAPGEML